MNHPSTDGATPGAALRAALVLPVSVGLVVPTILIATDPWRRPIETPSLVIGTIVTVSGTAMVVRAALDFFAVGHGTLAPWNPPRQLVTTGLFAHSRNPMYLGVLAVLAGLAMASRSPLLGVYLLSAAVGFHLRVVRNEEPAAERSFPDAWAHYRSAVPRWFPRLSHRSRPSRS